MMNKYINKLDNSMLCSHQLLNKGILLMKRESRGKYHFSFGEYFDELLLSDYPLEIQQHILSIHQIISFYSSLNPQ